MQKTIGISTDVFAAIWANRKEGEDTEDVILRRILGCKTNGSNIITSGANDRIGVFEKRKEIEFPYGFAIFRNYKNREYEAVAKDGFWQRTDTNKGYPTLNQLNSSIVDGVESAWDSWKYRDSNGEIQLLRNWRFLG